MTNCQRPAISILENTTCRIVSIMNTKVNKSGDTMTGKLIFDNGNVVSQSHAYAWNDKPATDTYYATSEFLDKNGVRMGVWEFSKNKDGTNSMNIVIKHGTGTGWDALRLYAKSDGSSWLNIPRSRVGDSACSTVSYGSNHVRFGNGIQICFGNSAVNQTITFQQPFKDAGYKVAFCQTVNAEHNINNTAVDKTTTSFKFNRGYTGDWIAIGYWY